MTKYRLFSLHWMDAWDELYRIIGNRKNVRCRLPDSSVVDVNRCKRWIQESVYRGYSVQLKEELIDRRPGILVSRSIGNRLHKRNDRNPM